MLEHEDYSFKFNENACSSCNGHCCRGESGYIWINPRETELLSSYFNLSIEEFKSKYLIKIGYKYSLKEIAINNEFQCIFFDDKSCGCSIYDLRPSQCKTFPFWNIFKTKPELAGKECPGIIYS